MTYKSLETIYRGTKLRLYVVVYELDRPGGPDRIVSGRTIGRGRYELVADMRAGLALGDRIGLGRDIFAVVGLTDGQVSSGGAPVVYITLRDSQQLQFELAPPAAPREIARGPRRLEERRGGKEGVS